jgi:hypothetical protein
VRWRRIFARIRAHNFFAAALFENVCIKDRVAPAICKCGNPSLARVMTLLPRGNKMPSRYALDYHGSRQPTKAASVLVWFALGTPGKSAKQPARHHGAGKVSDGRPPLALGKPYGAELISGFWYGHLN